MDNVLQKDLDGLQVLGLRRGLRQTQSPQGRTIIVDGRRVLNFCSNDYLGLADDEKVKAAAIASIGQDGFGSGASRLVGGNMSAHTALEERLAALKKTEACLLFSSGYMANTGIIPALVGRGDIVFCDRLNHASIIDGILLSRAQMKRYPHVDMAALEDGLKKASGHQRKLIVTDTIFSMDGDRAPLKDIVELARRWGAWVMVDEAHAFGVLGPTGMGLVEELRLSDQVQVQMGTLSKAAGCFGAYVCGSAVLKETLINHARSFIYTTGMPPSVAAAAHAGVNIIVIEPGRRRQLLDNADHLRQGFKALGLDTMRSTTPIIPILAGEADRAVMMSQKLFEQGFFVQAIRPPTVPVNTARLRVTVTAAHTREDCEAFLEAVKTICLF
ncbi:MAG: 8-amino-7-oxononanoate synthase [Candidatus Omnitrophota bacterium]|nr:8-amino-7-oxononanoate synthase [Candidatus Omnitrophota bacterium]